MVILPIKNIGSTKKKQKKNIEVDLLFQKLVPITANVRIAYLRLMHNLHLLINELFSRLKFIRDISRAASLTRRRNSSSVLTGVE